MITAPDNWTIYRDHVLGKVEAYCDSNIWKFEFSTIELWLYNFRDSIPDQYLALHLLDSIIYRSSEMALASYQRWLSTRLRIYDKQANNYNLNEWKQHLSTKPDDYIGTIFVGVTSSSSSGDSGNEMIRKLTTKLINQNRTRTPSEIDLEDSSYENIILIDDMIGSGKQSLEFADEFPLSEWTKSKNVIFAPLVAMQDGIDKLSKKVPNLLIDPLELFGAEQQLFSTNGEDYYLHDNNNTVKSFLSHYTYMRSRYNGHMPWLGWKKAMLPLVFEWGCPNQTLPIYSMPPNETRPDWNQLFSRRA